MKVTASASATRRTLAASQRNHGFTLLEVLVAIVVLSFGVLGVVGLQAAALQANKEARYQSAAVALGRELGDMMRGNKGLAITTTAATNPYLGDFPAGTSLSTTDNCFTGACNSPSAVGNFNMREWLARVQTALPGARVVVCFDANPYTSSGTGDGRPEWPCSDSGGLAVVKMGWSRQTYDRSASGPERASDASSRPVVVLPLIAGSVE
jgi:type IV pilus assembly protein PilV